ncbi:MAG TPA: hypothetical protein VMJ32_11310 [Pirellulales bacterium]|nr:hypothetical protein [Pirellulales bacterium]
MKFCERGIFTDNVDATADFYERLLNAMPIGRALDCDFLAITVRSLTLPQGGGAASRGTKAEGYDVLFHVGRFSSSGETIRPGAN